MGLEFKIFAFQTLVIKNNFLEGDTLGMMVEILVARYRYIPSTLLAVNTYLKLLFAREEINPTQTPTLLHTLF